MRRETIAPRPDWQRRVEEVGLEFHTQDGVPYWAEDRCYAFTVEEIDGIEALTSDLHKLCLDAVEQIVRRGWHSRLAIPDWVVPYVNMVWERGDPTWRRHGDKFASDSTGAPPLAFDQRDLYRKFYLSPRFMLHYARTRGRWLPGPVLRDAALALRTAAYMLSPR